MVKSCHVTCRMALDKAVADGLILKNPAANCKAPATHPREMAVLTGEEIQRLLIQAKEDGCYELLLLELSTGLRRGEILALQWDDLDFRTGALRIERQIQRIKGELVVSQPKTKTSNRSVILPGPILKVLERYRKSCSSRWMFPSPKKTDSPLDPAAVRKKLTSVLKRAGCKHLRFHDLRHTFATNALEHGMDIKTLSAIIGHVSSATTLNVYAHVTDEMRQKAADRIDRGIAGVEPPSKPTWKKESTPTPFRAVKGKYRKPGTGCMTQINDHLWEGRYSPKVNGKRIARNVYASTEEECERRLAKLIAEMKRELEPLRAKKKAG
ncbi:tyrosine-type recombinase/integrase [Flavonifractor sp. An306]|uniref:tyrosine-type recombinase/integrase n=2 Tax=Flavonifractor TaxID=946234 RepID=UPI0034526213